MTARTEQSYDDLTHPEIISEADHEAAREYFSLCEFMGMFQKNPKETVSNLVSLFPKEANNLRILLDGRTPSPVARLLQEYKVENDCSM